MHPHTNQQISQPRKRRTTLQIPVSMETESKNEKYFYVAMELTRIISRDMAIELRAHSIELDEESGLWCLHYKNESIKSFGSSLFDTILEFIQVIGLKRAYIYAQNQK